MKLHLPFTRTIKKVTKNYILKNNLCKLTKEWTFSEYRFNLLISEYLDWTKYYGLIPIKNKTVLDIGAGEGETAWFFKYYGAKTVIAVEPHPYAFKRLKTNAVTHNLTALNTKLTLNLLDKWLHKVDAVKCDIEGYEELLLDYNVTKPIILELHGLQLIDRFKQKGYTVIKKDLDVNDWDIYTKYAYKNMNKKAHQQCQL